MNRCQLCQRLRRVDVAFRQSACSEVECRLQYRSRVVVLFEIRLCLADDREQFDAAFGLRHHLAIDALFRQREQLRSLHLLLAGEVRVGGAEDRCDEFLHFLGALFLGACDAQLPRRDREARCEREHDRSGRTDGEPMLVANLRSR